VTQISKHIKNASVCGLSRAVQKDIEAAGEALKYAARPRIHTGIALQTSISKQNSMLRGGDPATCSTGRVMGKNYVDDMNSTQKMRAVRNEYLAQVIEQ